MKRSEYEQASGSHDNGEAVGQRRGHGCDGIQYSGDTIMS